MRDVIIIGGGPSGIMTGITASKRGLDVLLLEKNNGLGKKLLASGGGRCNITNRKPLTELMEYMNDRFLYKTLSTFGPEEIISFFEQRGVRLQEEDFNKIFPKSGRATDILNALKKELETTTVQIQYEEVQSVSNAGQSFTVQTNKNIYTCHNLVIATGGLTYPGLGSCGDGYEFARTFHHEIAETHPANTPLVSNDAFIQDKVLQGISLEDAVIKYQKVVERGPMIFTHFGISGPSALNTSKQIYQDLKMGPITITIDLLPNLSREMIQTEINNKKNIEKTLKAYLPNRLVEFIMIESDVYHNLSEISKKKMNKLMLMLKEFPVSIYTLKGYESAIVTAGGIQTKDVNPKTMESKLIPHLYFVGEVLDLDGKTGGYNHTIALSTGFTAGNSVSVEN